MRLRLLLVILLSFYLASVQAQAILSVSTINKILDTTHVTFRTTKLALNAVDDLRPFIRKVYEYNSIDKKYDSVSQGFGELKLGQMVQCDSVRRVNKTYRVYLSAKKKPSGGYLMPLDLLVAADHYEKEFLLAFLFKLSYLTNRPVTDMFVFVHIDADTDTEGLDSGEIKSLKVLADYAVFFTHEFSIAKVPDKAWTVATLQKTSFELHNYVSRRLNFLPRPGRSHLWSIPGLDI